MRRVAGVAALERLEALIANPELYALADAVPTTNPSAGGRPRQYPTFVWILYDALLSVYGSARRVEAELAHPVVWRHLRGLVQCRFPDDSSRWLPSSPMRRHHCLYGRTRWPTEPDVFDALRSLHQNAAVDQARQLGLLDPNGSGSWTHPSLSRMLYADGKVLTPLYRAHPEDVRIDPNTSEIRPARAERDGALHFEGTGETAWGTKWVHVAVRSEDVHGRIILDVDWVPSPGGEAQTAMNSFAGLAPLCPGAQGVIYDTALRGVHHQRLLRDLGWLSVNRVTAAVASTKALAVPVDNVWKSPRSSRSGRSAAPTESSNRSACSPEAAPSGSPPSTAEATDTSPSWLESERIATPTRPGTGGTTTTGSLMTSAAARSPCDSTATPKTSDGSSTAPRTSGRSRRPTRTSPGSTVAATTPKASTVPSTTPSGYGEPTASATNGST